MSPSRFFAISLTLLSTTLFLPICLILWSIHSEMLAADPVVSNFHNAVFYTACLSPVLFFMSIFAATLALLKKDNFRAFVWASSPYAAWIAFGIVLYFI